MIKHRAPEGSYARSASVPLRDSSTEASTLKVGCWCGRRCTVAIQPGLRGADPTGASENACLPTSLFRAPTQPRAAQPPPLSPPCSSRSSNEARPRFPHRRDAREGTGALLARQQPRLLGCHPAIPAPARSGPRFPVSSRRASPGRSVPGHCCHRAAPRTPIDLGVGVSRSRSRCHGPVMMFATLASPIQSLRVSSWHRPGPWEAHDRRGPRLW